MLKDLDNFCDKRNADMSDFWDKHWWKIVGAVIFLGMLAVIWFDPAGRYLDDEEGGVSDVNISEGVQDSSEDLDYDTEEVDGDSADDSDSVETGIRIYHNGTGPMCLEAIEFFEQEGYEYEEFLTTEEDFNTRLNEVKSDFNGESEGVSGSFGYYPVIVVDGRVFSGFDSVVEAEIKEVMEGN